MYLLLDVHVENKTNKNTRFHRMQVRVVDAYHDVEVDGRSSSLYERDCLRVAVLGYEELGSLA